MVYCGKPSRGCQMCRTRRIKCDETKPTCNQCAKSRRHCPGYKDEFDLVFRNETEATERRARKANQKAIARMEKIEVNAGLKSTTGQVVAPPSLPDDVKADHYFVANFVLLPRPGSGSGTRGFFEYIMPLYKAATSTSHFKLAFEACSLALFHNRKKQTKKMETAARGKYTKALTMTHKALQDPAHATSDLTLAAILLLSLYENISAMHLGQLGWGSHIEGAISIVKTRGRELLKTGMGQELFIAVRTQMIVHTMSSGKAPIMGPEWWVNDAFNDWHGAQCQKLNIRVAELRAEVNRLMETVTRTPENIELMTHMIERCQIVEQELIAWEKDLPDVFRWITVTWVDDVPNGDYSKAEVFPGRVDAYQDLWVVSVWSMQRVSRLYLGSMIVRCAAWICSPVDYRTTPEFRTAQRTALQISDDIIASVPYQLGWLQKRPDLRTAMARSGFACGQDDDEEMRIKGLPGYFLTWPLACVHGQDYITEDQRTWVKGRLDFIGTHAGVRYAHILKNLEIRWPSMLIRKDGLMANPYPTGHDFEQLLRSGKSDDKPNSRQDVEEMTPAQQYTLYKHLQTADPPRAEAMKQAFEKKLRNDSVNTAPAPALASSSSSASPTGTATLGKQLHSPAATGVGAMSPAQQFELYQYLLLTDPPRAAEMKRIYEARMATAADSGPSPPSTYPSDASNPLQATQQSPLSSNGGCILPAGQYELYQRLLVTDPSRAAEMKRAFDANMAENSGGAPATSIMPSKVEAASGQGPLPSPSSSNTGAMSPRRQYELYQNLLKTDPAAAAQVKHAYEVGLSGGGSATPPLNYIPTASMRVSLPRTPSASELDSMTPTEQYELFQRLLKTDPAKAEAIKRAFEARLGNAASTPSPTYELFSTHMPRTEQLVEQPQKAQPGYDDQDGMTSAQRYALYQSLTLTDPQQAAAMKRDYENKMSTYVPLTNPAVVQPPAPGQSFKPERLPMPNEIGEYNHLTPYQQMELYRQLVETDPPRAEAMRRAFQMGTGVMSTQ